MIVFHEQASPLKAIAIVLIIAGVVCLNLSARHPSQSSVEAQAQLRSDLRMEPKANAGTVGAPRVASATVRPVTVP